jgi:hypothetical protein
MLKWSSTISAYIIVLALANYDSTLQHLDKKMDRSVRKENLHASKFEEMAGVEARLVFRISESPELINVFVASL